MSRRIILGISIAVIALAVPTRAGTSQSAPAQKPSGEVSEVLHQALLAAQQITTPIDKSFALQNIAILFVQAGDSENATKIQNSLTEQWAKDNVTYFIAYFAASNGKLAEALSIAQRIDSKLLREQCFGAISGLRAVNGDLPGARTALNSIQDPSARAQQLDSDMAAFSNKLSKSDMDSLIALAIKNANEFPDNDSRMHWLLRSAINASGTSRSHRRELAKFANCARRSDERSNHPCKFLLLGKRSRRGAR